jgi:hypothetical protein
MGIYTVPTKNAIQTTLDATLASGGSSATLATDLSTQRAGVSATNPGVFVVDRIDSNGNATPTKREYCSFTGVSGAGISGITKNADGSGTDQEHAAGAIVEFVADVLWGKSIRDTFEVDHGADGTHNKTGSDTDLVSGTAGTTDYTAKWNADGDLVEGFEMLDEDAMTSNSATKLASQQSIKAYVDAGDNQVVGINFLIDGSGAAITTGIKGDIMIPFACTINQVNLLADQSGSIAVDIWKDTYANFPPTDADTITASAVPTISSATKDEDATLTDWTTAIAAGSILRFNVDSCTTITRCTLVLKVTRS